MRRLWALVALALLLPACIGTEIGRAEMPGEVAFVANGQTSYGLALHHPSDNEQVRDALLDAIQCAITDRTGTQTVGDSSSSVETTVNNTTRWYEFTPPEGQVSIACQFVPQSALSQRWVTDEEYRSSMVVLQSDE